jgi:hypothetical protein
MRNNINPHFVSLFVYHAVYKTMTGCLASTSSLTLSQTFHSLDKGEIKPSAAYAVACPLLWVIAGLEYMQLEQPIVTRASLKSAMQGIRRLFSFEDAPPDVRKQAKMFLEHDLANARVAGLAALDEALAGFPVSGGDLTLWEERRLTICSKEAMADQ